jgi:hypothetical protein
MPTKGEEMKTDRRLVTDADAKAIRTIVELGRETAGAVVLELLDTREELMAVLEEMVKHGTYTTGGIGDEPITVRDLPGTARARAILAQVRSENHAGTD